MGGKAAEEGEGTTAEMEDNDVTEILTSFEALDVAVILHVVKEIIGFVLYMHEQIPSVLQDLSLQFDEFHTTRKDLELVMTQSEVKASSRRMYIGKMREAKQGIRRLEKLMNGFASLQTAIQLMLNEIHNVQEVMLILGSSPVRPLYVYQILFSHGTLVSDHSEKYTESRISEALSRKAVRELINKGAGSVSYAGPIKLFLLIKAPATFNLPLHFLPKRDFRYSKKIVPFRLRIKCKVRKQDKHTSQHCSPSSRSLDLPVATSTDLIWFQCKHVIKGIPLKAPSPDE